jgi:D-alanyl-D-alanine-carboxypeptidase/D-alanyl-D-alanine-endopeptidase
MGNFSQWCCRLSVLLIISLSACIAAPEPPALITSEAQAYIQHRVDQQQNTGIVVGIVEPGGEEFFSFGTKLINTDEPVNEDTLFEIGSITKIFTTLLLADMVQQGELSLDDALQEFLPAGIQAPGYKGESITLMHLATHTSGLPLMPLNFSPEDIDNPYVDYSTEDLLDFLNSYALNRPPGQRFEYSNLGVGTLGQALVFHSRQNYADLLRKRITSRLGMPDTVLDLDAEQQARLATGHFLKRPVQHWDFDALVGAGAIRSTARDLTAFLAAEVGLVETPSASAMQLTHSALFPTDEPGVQIALGWFVRELDGRQILYHEGGTGGFYAFVGFVPEAQMGVVILTNTQRKLDDLAFNLLDPTYPLDQEP